MSTGRLCNCALTLPAAEHAASTGIARAPGSTVGVTLEFFVNDAGAIEVDHANDVLIAVPTDGGVSVFPPGYRDPKYVFAQNARLPRGMAFNKAEDQIFVENAITADVFEYQYPSGTLLKTFPLAADSGIAYSPAGSK